MGSSKNFAAHIDAQQNTQIGQHIHDECNQNSCKQIDHGSGFLGEEVYHEVDAVMHVSAECRSAAQKDQPRKGNADILITAFDGEAERISASKAYFLKLLKRGDVRLFSKTIQVLHSLQENRQQILLHFF